MPSFRSNKAQAMHAISLKLALRYDLKNDGRIHSLGTARGYGNSLKALAGYLKEHRLGDLRGLTIGITQRYLEERATTVSQKTLDLDRQAIQMHLGVRLEVIRIPTSPPGVTPASRSNGSPGRSRTVTPWQRRSPIMPVFEPMSI